MTRKGLRAENGIFPGGEPSMTANLQQVKAANRSLIFGSIHWHGMLSRAGLTEMTRLSPTTVSSLVDELIGLGLVIERGPAETRTSGRKPVMLTINPIGGFFASVELTQAHFDLALYDLNCVELGLTRKKATRYAGIGARLIRALESLMLECGLEPKRLQGICVGAPAIIDPERKVILISTVLPIRPGTEFLAELQSRFPGIPVRLENESGLRCYAEMEYGALSGMRDLLYIDIDEVIGSGLILDGRIYRGSTGRAGEIGHVSIDYDGPACVCGNQGCLELLANVPALIRRVIDGMESGKPSALRAIIAGHQGRVNLEAIREALELGDSLAMQAVDETARLLAVGINSVLNILNPRAVVIGGRMAELGQPFIDRLEDHLARIALGPSSGVKRVHRSAVEGNAATLGGARLLLDEYLRQPGLGGEDGP